MYVYKLKSEDVKVLREAHGPLFDTAEELLKKCDGPLAVVGDKASAEIIAAGGNPKLVVYDMRERRETISQEVFDKIQSMEAEEEVVENSAGRITQELWDTLKFCLAEPPKKVRVIGEEDLAALAVIVLAPTGTCVAYGLKNKITLITIDEKIKKMAKDIIGI